VASDIPDDEYVEAIAVGGFKPTSLRWGEVSAVVWGFTRMSRVLDGDAGVTSVGCPCIPSSTPRTIGSTWRLPSATPCGLSWRRSPRSTGIGGTDLSKRGDELIESARQALAWVRGEDMPGVRVHEAGPAVDVRAVRRKTGLTSAGMAWSARLLRRA
jgi:hypothetical protein